MSKHLEEEMGGDNKRVERDRSREHETKSYEELDQQIQGRRNRQIHTLMTGPLHITDRYQVALLRVANPFRGLHQRRSSTTDMVSTALQ